MVARQFGQIGGELIAIGGVFDPGQLLRFLAGHQHWTFGRLLSRIARLQIERGGPCAPVDQNNCARGFHTSQVEKLVALPEFHVSRILRRALHNRRAIPNLLHQRRAVLGEFFRR